MWGKTQSLKKELESFGGLLAHCSHMVDGGRTHSRRFYESLQGNPEKLPKKITFRKGSQGGFRLMVEIVCYL